MALVVVIALAFLFLQPFPFSTIAQGVIWVPREGTINPEADGAVVELAVEQGEQVAPGDVLMRLEDPLLDARVVLVEATVKELERRLEEALATDPTRTRIAREELTHAQADLELARERQDALTVRASAAGTVVLNRSTDLVGRFVRKGEVLGYVSTFRDPIVRAVVTERNADLVRESTDRLVLRFVTDPASVHAARVARELPALSETLPSLALSTEGGGEIILDPTAPRGGAAFENLLHLEVRVDPDMPFETIGERVFLRFVHPPESIASRVYRRARQIFLQRFEI